ncbi:MAG: hypothetical protein ACK4FS_11450, partial [Flavobacterium sp.]
MAELLIARKEATLNPDYTGSVEELLSGKTPFCEITIEPAELPQSLQELDEIEAYSSQTPDIPLIRKGNSRIVENLDILAIIESLHRAIEKTWDPTKFHIILHSSGYDSRIISKVIANLRDKNGRKWLGKVLFICWEPEGESFEKIMKAEGWEPNEYHICNRNAQPDEYYSEVLAFEQCWKWINDAQPPIFIHGYEIQKLKAQGKIPSLAPIQIIGGGGGNECVLLRPKDLLNMFYYSRWNQMLAVIEPSEVIMPFLSYDVLQHISPYVPKLKLSYPAIVTRMLSLIRRVLGFHPSALEIKILKILAPELLRIKRVSDGPKAPQRQLSKRLREKCRKDFEKSWLWQQILVKNPKTPQVEPPRTLWVH